LPKEKEESIGLMASMLSNQTDISGKICQTRSKVLAWFFRMSIISWCHIIELYVHSICIRI
jgi:hypothetical protein